MMISAAVPWLVGAMVGVATPTSSSADPWLDLRPPGAAAEGSVELDVLSIHEGMLGPEATIRVSPGSFLAPYGAQSAYRSWTMHILFRCESWRLEPLAVSFFSGTRGQGAELDARTNLSREGVPEDLLSSLHPSVLESLLRAACAQAAVRHSGGPRCAVDGRLS